jgi:hypothetical protein
MLPKITTRILELGEVAPERGPEEPEPVNPRELWRVEIDAPFPAERCQVCGDKIKGGSCQRITLVGGGTVYVEGGCERCWNRNQPYGGT